MPNGYSSSTGGGPGAMATTGGGGGGVLVSYRDPLDMARSVGRLPEAEYPEGYLGQSPRTRYRSDQQGYDRGPAARTVQPPEAYEWPEDFNMSSALEAQQRGERFVPAGMQDPLMVKMAQGVSAAGVRMPSAGAEVTTNVPGDNSYPGYAGPTPFSPAMLEKIRPPWTI